MIFLHQLMLFYFLFCIIINVQCFFFKMCMFIVIKKRRKKNDNKFLPSTSLFLFIYNSKHVTLVHYESYLPCFINIARGARSILIALKCLINARLWMVQLIISFKHPGFIWWKLKTIFIMINIQDFCVCFFFWFIQMDSLELRRERKKCFCCCCCCGYCFFFDFVAISLFQLLALAFVSESIVLFSSSSFSSYSDE